MAAVDDAAGTNVIKWGAFVKGQKIGGVKLANYYGVDLVADPFVDTDLARLRRVELAAEFFRDIVATGALTLPPGVVVDDFDFAERWIGQDPSGCAMTSLNIRSKGSGRENLCVARSSAFLNKDMRLGDRKLETLIECICLSVGELLESSRH